MRLQNDVGRTCGNCNACCTTFPVPEVGKNDSSLCHHARGGQGCSIYADRPEACKLYACMWLNGFGDDSLRPDRSGVMMDCIDGRLDDRGFPIIHLWEMRKGALRQKFFRELANANKDNGAVICTHRRTSETSFDSRFEMRSYHFTHEEMQRIADM